MKTLSLFDRAMQKTLGCFINYSISSMAILSTSVLSTISPFVTLAASLTLIYDEITFRESTSTTIKELFCELKEKMRLVLILWMKFLRRTLFHFSSWSMARVLASLCAYQRGSSTSCFWSQVTAPKSSTLKAFVESRPCRCPPKFWFTSPTTSSFSGQNWRQSILKPNT